MHFAKSNSCDQFYLLRCTLVFALGMRIYRPQKTDRVCCGSPSSCNSFLGMSILNITRMNHCFEFKTAWTGVAIFTSGLSLSLWWMETYFIWCSLSYVRRINPHAIIWNALMKYRLMWALCIPQTKNVKVDNMANEWGVRNAEACLELWHANVQLRAGRIMLVSGVLPSWVILVAVRSIRPLINFFEAQSNILQQKMPRDVPQIPTLNVVYHHSNYTLGQLFHSFWR